MTTASTTDPQVRPDAPGSRRWPGAAVASVIGAIGLNAFGIWGDGTGGEDDRLFSFLLGCGFVAAGAALVFGLIVPRGLRRLAATGRAGVSALVVSILALLLVPMFFWSGLPPVLAAGGIVLGLAGRGAARSAIATAATAVGLLALVADVALFVVDWLATNGMM